jgi:hypothetical protein
MMHIVNNLMKISRLNLFSTTKCYIQISKKCVKDTKNYKNKAQRKRFKSNFQTKNKTKLCD